MVDFRPYTGASDMVKCKYCFNEEEIESLQSKGRGSGVGRDYLPWISIFWNGLIVSLISGSSFLSIITLLLKLQKTQALVIRGFVKLDLTPF